MKQKQRNTINHILLFPLLLLSLFVVLFTFSVNANAAERLQDFGEEIVIVIDPGHGGDNLGTEEGYILEKEMTLITANAMVEALSDVPGITVVLTRTGDENLKLSERAEIAKEAEADFLISLHYNASVNHNLYGSEVWVSGYAPYNAYGMQFAGIFLDLAKESGNYIRGIKTRFLSDEDKDYYGIIRESVAREIPSLIIEHAHVDQSVDSISLDSVDKLKEYGIMDAKALLLYLGFEDMDHTDSYLDADINTCNAITQNDTTPPIELGISIEPYAIGDTSVSVNVTAAEGDGILLYYDYSIDGGATFSNLIPYPEADAIKRTYATAFQCNIDVQPGIINQVLFRVYNQYDLSLESNRMEVDLTVPEPVIDVTRTDDSISNISEEPSEISSEIPENMDSTISEAVINNDIIEKIIRFAVLLFGSLFFILLVANLLYILTHRRK